MANIDEIFAAHGFAGAPRGATTGVNRFTAIGNAANSAGKMAPKAKERSLGEKLLPAAGAIGVGLLAAPLTGGLSLPLAIALAGGAAAAGGAGGELLAQKINEEDKANGGFDWEKFRNEGLISGAFGAGGAAIQGGRAAYGLTKAGMPVSKALTSSAASPAAAGLTSPKNLVDALTGVSGGADDAAKVATSLRARGLGVDELAKKEGSRGLTRAAENVATANEYGIKSGMRGLKQSGKELAALETKFQGLGQQTVPVSEVNSLLDDIAKNSSANVSTSVLNRTIASQKKAVLNASKDGVISISELRNIRGGNGSIWKGSDTATKDLGKEIYGGVNELIAKQSPEARALISEQGRLLNLEESLKGTVGTAKATVPFVGNVPVPGLAAVRDRGIDAVSGVRGFGQKAMSGVSGAAIRGGVTQGVPRMFTGSGQPQDPAAQDMAAPDQYGQDPMMAGGMDSASQQAPQQSLYPLEQALMDIQRDPKNTEKYLSVYKTVAAQEKAAGGGGANVGKVSAQQYQLAQQGYNALNQFANLIQSDPGVVSRSATPGRSLPGVGGVIANASGTAEFDTLGFAAISSLLRAQSGAAVPDSEVRSYMKAYLPRPGDTPAVTQRKLQTLNYAYQTVFSGANNGAASGSTEQDLLMQGGF